MKSSYKIIVLVISFFSFSFILKAQTVAEAIASATVITPITMEKTADMNFGDLYVQGTSGGTVVLEVSGERIKTGGVLLPVSSVPFTHATFAITSTKVYSYDISLPLFVTLNHTKGFETMTASDFTTTPVTNSNYGMQNLAIGAKITVAAAQASGIYTSSNFNVTINYN